MPFAAALSEHPNPAVAIGEAAGQVLDVLGAGPVDLAVLFAGGRHAAALVDAAAVVRTLLQPTTLVGATAASVLAGGREVEDTAALALWVGRFGAVHPFRAGPGARPADPPFEPSALVLLADPFTFAIDEALAGLEARWPGLPVVGGMASAGRGPGGNRFVLDDSVTTAGAVGVFLGPGVEVETVVSQGAKPVGRPFAVTEVDGTVVRQLAGRPAMTRLLELAYDALTAEEVDTINRGGLQVGRVVDEHRADFGRGDFLVREIVGANRIEGWIALADEVVLGETLQYHLRDPDTADDDLRAALNGRAADAALVFTCTARGVRFFDAAHHDAAIVDEYLGRPAVAGMFCAGEVGPVGGRNFVHTSTATMALLRERPAVR